MRHLVLVPVLVLGSSALVAAEPAAPRPVAAITADSKPAKPAAAAPANPVAPVASDYELRGFFGAGEDLEVSVRRIGEEQSRWLRVGVKSGDVLVEKADAQAGTATILTGGRRYTLRLASASVAAPETESVSGEDAREARRARFREMAKNATPEQMTAFRKVMEARIPELRKAHPELFSGRPPDNAEARRQMGAIFAPVLHEAAEAAAALPGKDGKITPVPADFDTLVAESVNDAPQRRPQRPAPAEGNDASPATTPAP